MGKCIFIGVIFLYISKMLPVDDFIHKRMLEAVRLYIIIGGMPAAVQKYLDTNNLRRVYEEQRGIIRTYKRDITKYGLHHKLQIEEIYDLIPSELDAKNKRFILKELNEKARLLSHESDINFGSFFENLVVQELYAHGFTEGLQHSLYYFISKKQGELDYERHNALSNVMANEEYNVPQAYVFCQENLRIKGKITYYPIYMITFFEQIRAEDEVYEFDLTGLGDKLTKE